MTGTIKTFNNEKGFGFIVPSGKQPRENDQFFHVTKCVDGYHPQVGDLVQFEEGVGRDDKTCAVSVRLAE